MSNPLNVLDEYVLSPEDLSAKKVLDSSNLKSNGVPKPFCGENPSPYQKNTEYRSAIEQDFPREKSGFYNPRDPFIVIQREKAVHLNMCYLSAAGNSLVEIAEVTGYSTITISNVLRQPWARERVAEIIKKSGRSEVELLLKGAAAKAVNRLITELDSTIEGANAQSRISSAKELLDRVFGKSTQPIIHASVDLSKLSDDELAAMLPTINGTTNTQ